MTRKNTRHRKFVSLLPCCVCGRGAPSDAAHISMPHFEGVTIPYSEQKFMGKGGKTHDKWTVPLCRACHNHQHITGETTFWTMQGTNPLALAASLWANTGNLEAARGIVGRARMGATL